MVFKCKRRKKMKLQLLSILGLAAFYSVADEVTCETSANSPYISDLDAVVKTVGEAPDDEMIETWGGPCEPVGNSGSAVVQVCGKVSMNTGSFGDWIQQIIDQCAGTGEADGLAGGTLKALYMGDNEFEVKAFTGGS